VSESANFSPHFFGFAHCRLPRGIFFRKKFGRVMNEPTQMSGGVKEAESPAGSLSRRSFLAVLVGFGSALMGAALSVPLIRFALHPLVATTTKIGWSDVGKLDEFASLTAPTKKIIHVEQRDAWRKIVSEKPVYVMPAKDGAVRVLSPICPHLGCSIPWNEEKQEFICPCHAAVFDKSGARVSGPSPRSMDDLEIKVEDGIVKVHYQYFRQLIPQKEPLS
jgi:menaquinol-cytochrome c reductase iron-sulfur subunit